MTLELARHGSITVLADADGMRLTGPSTADLSSRRGWPEDALSTPDGARLSLETEQCLEMDLASSLSNEVFIANEAFPQIRRRGLGLTELSTKWAPLLLKIDRASDIGRPEFQYRYSFLHESRPIKFKRVGYFGTISGDATIYRLDDQTFALVSEMDRFNQLLPTEKGRSRSWIAFSKVKDCAIDVGARLDAYLLSNDVVVPQQLNLEIHTWPDGSISFAPQIPGVESPGLKRAFFNNPTAQDFYSVDGPNQSRVRVVFDERQTEALGRMKDVHHAKGEDKERILGNPEAIMEGFLDIVDVRYGRRVTGIGSIIAPAIAPLARSRSVLETGLPNGGPSSKNATVRLADSNGQTVQVSLSTPAQKQDLVAAAIHAVENQASTFPFDGREFKVDENVRSFIEKQQDPVGSRGDDSPFQQAGAYLLPYQDNEDLKSWDVMDAQEARRACRSSAGHVLPSSLHPDVVLKAHQLEGIAWLQTCHSLRPCRRGSLLADDMGLGKTLQILSYLAWCIEHDRDLGLSDSTPPWRPILVVLPLILLESNTWENEISARFRAGVFDPILVLHGDAVKKLRRGKTVGKETVLGKPLISPSDFANYRVVITNYQTLTNYQHSFAQLIPGTQRSMWSVLITDEAQEYKSPSTKISYALKTLHPDVHIACTGTPVENRLLDLWNLIDTVQPALLGTSKDFSAKYELEAGNSTERLLELKQNLLFNTANAFVLRRNKSEVLLDLPPKTFEPVYSEMTDWEIRMHQELLQSVGGSPLKILHKLVALYQHPSLLRGDGGALDALKLLDESSKLRTVVELLKTIRSQGEKCVIFAYRISMQQILATVIESVFGFQADIVNGSTAKSGGVDAGSLGSQQARRTRNAMLERFRHAPGFSVIILSPFVASIGLTITEANHVIHYGRWWNPAVEAQATDRVYRIGQTKPVHVHLPILRDTQGRLPKSFDQNLHELIEEKQLQAQNFLSPLPEESRIGEELFGKLKEETPTQNLSEQITAETVDKLPHHLFEALVALLLEKQGYKTILTAQSNDGGADVLAFREGELWLIQAKHTKKDYLINSVAMGDLMAAAQAYSRPLSYSLHLLAVTNGSFIADTRNEAERNGIRLLDRHKLMADLRTHPVSLGAVYVREDDRCASFNEGVRAANLWFTK